MDNTDVEKIKMLLIRLRRFRGLSQEDMGALLGVSGRTVGRWENGTSIPSMIDVMNICREYDLTPNELFSGMINNKAGFEENSDSLSVEEQDDTGNGVFRKICDTLFWLFIIHVIAAFIGYLGMYLIVSYAVSVITGIVYIVLYSVIIFKNRENKSVRSVLLVYCVVSCISVIGNYVSAELINHNEFMLNQIMAVFNGPLFGLWIPLRNNTSMLIACVLIYVIWLFLILKVPDKAS